jgi:nicotinate phosphoribosyltransferase
MPASRSSPEPIARIVIPMSLALSTDLYELTMLRAYWELGHDGEAVFSLFVRRLPKNRNFLIACGLEDLLDQLQGLRFDADDLTYLEAQGFPPSILERLEQFRFGGDVHALPEGTPVFANEPIVEIVAPIAEAQLIETLVINQIGFQTLIASKAARVVHAAAGRDVIDFGGRRAHGLDAAVKAARAAYVAGAAATSNVLAGKTYGIPVAGTMAHSFVQAYDSEAEAFRAFASVFPETTLLVDTYDTLGGVAKVIALGRELGERFRVRAVRLDSGDLAHLSRGARAMLDGAGLSSVRIFASGGLDEREITRLIAGGAEIDGFGVGTDLVVSGDAPSLDLVYKLTEYSGAGRMKLSPDKRTLPGRKQVFREWTGGGPARDVLARHDESLPGTPLLGQVMRRGERIAPSQKLSEIRARCREEVGRLPSSLRTLETAAPPFQPEVSPALEGLADQVARKVAPP